MNTRKSLFVLFLILVSSFAWLSGWNYRREIMITENSGSSLTDYQVLIELNSSNFDFSKANADGSDIRFTDTSDNLLDYWIESWNSTEETAKIWVKVPSISASGTTTIYIYYGNENATSLSDAEAVFDLYDDFEGTNLDTSKWDDIDAKASVSSGILTLSNSGGHARLHSKSSFSSGIFEYLYNPVSSSASGFEQVHWKASSSDTYYMYQRGSTGKITIYKRVSGTYTSLETSTNTIDLDTWYVGKIVLDENSVYINNTFFVSTSDTELSSGSVGFDAYKGTVKVDWARIRKYADPEPSVSVGSEETNTTLTFIYFIYSPSDPHVEEPILFNITSAENMTEFWWDFGDGNITHTTETTIYHTYYLGGNYLVNLTGYNNYTGENESTWTTVTVFEPTIYIYARNNQTGTLLSNFTVRVWNSTTEETFTSNGTVASWSYHEGPKGNISLLVLKDYYNSTVKNLYISNSSDLNYTDDLIPAVMIFRVLSSDYNIPIPGKITINNITNEHSKNAEWDEDVVMTSYFTTDAHTDVVYSNDGQIFYVKTYQITAGGTGTPDYNYSYYICDTDHSNCKLLHSDAGEGGEHTWEYYIYVSKAGTYKLLDDVGNTLSSGSFPYFPITVKVTAYKEATAYTGWSKTWIYVPSDLIIYASDPEYLTGNVTITIEQSIDGFFGYLEDSYASVEYYYENINTHTIINNTAYLIPSADALDVRFTIVNIAEDGIAGAIVRAYINKGGEWVEAASGKTDGTGITYLTLDKNGYYRIIVSKSGYEPRILDIYKPASEGYKIKLSESAKFFQTPLSNLYVHFYPEENIIVANETINFTATIVDSDGILEYATMKVINENGTLLAEKTITTPVGGIIELPVLVSEDEGSILVNLIIKRTDQEEITLSKKYVAYTVELTEVSLTNVLSDVNYLLSERNIAIILILLAVYLVNISPLFLLLILFILAKYGIIGMYVPIALTMVFMIFALKGV